MKTTASPPPAPLPSPPCGAPQAARPSALIVAHGSPADPEPQEAWLAALAVRVAMWCPGWTVRAATLAADGALARALAGLDRPVIYPFFMAEGWFTRTNLPKKLAAAGGEGLRQLPAFGHDPEMPALLARAARDGAAAHGITPEGATLILAAHGSQVSRASATITEEMAASLRREAGFAAVVTGYVEEAPFLADAARGISGPAICLPFFATRAGHVAQDVPEALAEAGFTGTLLPAIGEHSDAARLIADALQAAPALQMAPA
ncbi:cobalamin biosynthesis protein CbiX [Aliigemmobacter aestuarii]|uniref:Cobalamin biosynthesis protein CbiX n=1 Tax=Aliigemmobacter aestuarii TaxID=1445661 RepID=A0A4S3MSR3_9RHOB|nr:CbiX/SirB N-terminal domain-containing protein [Gemmobacter aestuarii]THD84511.1 cobalamin biosynthesis protein CbiX [Gemmobacter aestuarii]